ncbi:hypothetical protein DID88_009190 [Monilinia fructigena]|uniref:NLE domain-containing protein n=1 Tax=Monilinia fructigena TaxID=38457 RepID=A0A395IEZ9_9HELO|nr:hypothetical protein DID88_009190 [Monilinia fructigena]
MTPRLPIGNGPVLVPVADADPKNLELLLNTLMGHDTSEYIPYRFTLPVPDKKSSEKITTAYPTNIYKNLNITKIDKYGRGSEYFSSTTGSVQSSGSFAMCFYDTRSWRGYSSYPVFSKIFLSNGTPVHTLKGHTSWVLAVSWSPDESRIATGSMDNTGHTKWVTSLAWEPYHVQKPGEPRLASSSKDATVRIWSTNQQKIELVLSGHKGSVSCVKWGGTGFIYTASQDKTVKVWNAKDGTLTHSLNAHAHWVNHLALSTDFVMRTAYYDHTGKIPATDEEKVKKANERFLKASKIQGEIVERLVSASDDFTMYLWEPSKQTKPVARMLGHQKQVNHVTFSPDGLTIASSGFDNHTKIWNARDGKFINTLRGHVAPVYQCAFSPDSRLLVTGSKDTTLKVWDMRTHKLAEDLPGHKDEVYAVDWSPDGQKVGSGGKDKAVRIWRH